MMSLTPYDTGDVLEPRTWVTSTAGLTADNKDAFGKVDFDDDESATRLIVQVVRNDPRSDSGAEYTIRLAGEPYEFDIEWVED